ncbi:MAG: sugar MFS transporter, partial [Bacteroidales bacterium]|nr:sugar MFS transporter [Bacteroidales bacterium]
MSQSNTQQVDKPTLYKSIAILASMFFVFGFVSWVNAILIPYFKISCELNHFQSYFVTLAFYIAYFVMAIPSGILLKKLGFKKGILVGYMFMSLGAFIFVPAALTREYFIFLIGLFSIGTGLAILQTAANPLVTIIGPIDSAARRMSIMGICN